MNLTLIVIIVYLAVIFAVAWYFSRKESLGGYFLNNKKTSLWLLTLSNVATVVGAGATVAVVAEVYDTGISYGIILPVSFVIGMIVMGLIAKTIRKFGEEHETYTIADFFHKRFGMKNKILAEIIQVSLLVIWIGVQAIAIASLASVLTGTDYKVALFLTAAITILYTSIGGLKIDIITDFIQFWIIIAVFAIMAFLAYNQVGGVNSLLTRLPSGHLYIFNFGGVVWAIGAILLSGFIYMGNASHWQRILSAKNKDIARKSFFLSIPFILVIALITLFLGLVSAISLPSIDKNQAIFSLMVGILPAGLVGLGFAAILAVIMSSIDSLLVGGSTIIYRALFRKHQFKHKKEILYARLITALFGVSGFFLAFMVPNIITLSLVVSYLALIFAPPIFAGLYSKKISSDATFYSILIPTIALFSLYPILAANTFIVSTPLGIFILLFYDKIFKKKDFTPLEMVGIEE